MNNSTVCKTIGEMQRACDTDIRAKYFAQSKATVAGKRAEFPKKETKQEPRK